MLQRPDGRYLAGIDGGVLQWSTDVASGLRHMLESTAWENINTLREFYKVSDVAIVHATLEADPSRPGRWRAADAKA